jgi:hypothetical protein
MTQPPGGDRRPPARPLLRVPAPGSRDRTRTSKRPARRDPRQRDDDLDAHVKKVVDSLPPLTDEQRDLLARIFRSRHHRKLARPRTLERPRRPGRRGRWRLAGYRGEEACARRAAVPQLSPCGRGERPGWRAGQAAMGGYRVARHRRMITIHAAMRTRCND